MSKIKIVVPEHIPGWFQPQKTMADAPTYDKGEYLTYQDWDAEYERWIMEYKMARYIEWHRYYIITFGNLL